MKFELERLAQFDDDSIIAELKRVSSLVPDDLKLTTARFNEHAKVSDSTVKRRFGGWYKALQVAGLGYRYSGRSVSPKMKSQPARNMTDDQLIFELKRVASELRSVTLTQAEFNSRSEISASAVSRRFTSWNNALNAADLKPVSMGRRYTENDYFENLLNVWTYYGRQPRYIEMNLTPSIITSGAYEKRWGSWSKALIAFVERINADQSDSSPQPIKDKQKYAPRKRTPAKVEDKHKIPLGVRYNVLRRDHFKCVLCGNSPAIDPKCKLHVDHILPFSKNGKTVKENLRTLCEYCNLGKSDKIETIQQG